MKSPKGCLLLLLGLAVLSLIFTAVSYYGSYLFDLCQRPWAYLADPANPLLVGKWTGAFHDSDDVQKTLKVEILMPETDEERWNKAGDRKRRGSHRRVNKKASDGFATISSRRGAEQYELWGQRSGARGLHVCFFYAASG